MLLAFLRIMERLDLAEFSRLSWQRFNKDRYRLEEGKNGTESFVILDGARFPLDKPVSYNGRRVVFLRGLYDNSLYARQYDDYYHAQHSEMHPYEDYANSFRAYFGESSGTRKVDVSRAEEKLEFFEEELGLNRVRAASEMLQETRTRFEELYRNIEEPRREEVLEAMRREQAMREAENRRNLLVSVGLGAAAATILTLARFRHQAAGESEGG